MGNTTKYYLVCHLLLRFAKWLDEHEVSHINTLLIHIIPPSYLTSHNNENMLLWDSGASAGTRRSILIGTERNLDILKESQHWYVDGTFKVVPSLFYQMVSVHGQLPSGWSIPCCYALLPGKTESLYTELFTALSGLRDFTPDSIMS